MTHSNHRRGDRESLERDFVILVRGPVKYFPNRAKKALKILSEHNPVGLMKRRRGKPLRYMRNWKEGPTLNEIVENPDPPTYLAAVFNSKKDVEGVLKDLKSADLGFSIVVSGVFDTVFDICDDVGLTPHTVNMSMEAIGRTELLPENTILDITTMCGHSIISQYLVQYLINEVRKGRITSEEAGLELSKQCVCNFGNPIRTAKLIEDCVHRQR